jgi:hypothetical protein
MLVLQIINPMIGDGQALLEFGVLCLQAGDVVVQSLDFTRVKLDVPQVVVIFDIRPSIVPSLKLVAI